MNHPHLLSRNRIVGGLNEMVYIKHLAEGLAPTSAQYIVIIMHSILYYMQLYIVYMYVCIHIYKDGFIYMYKTMFLLLILFLLQKII